MDARLRQSRWALDLETPGWDDHRDMRSLLIIAALLTACAQQPAQPPAGLQERVSGDRKPTNQERQQLIARLYGYWTAISQQRWDAAFDFHTYDYREQVPMAVWRKQLQDWPSLPQPDRIHWTKGMFRHHGPELYAIVDWSTGNDPKDRAGRLIWRQETDGTFWIENSDSLKLRR